MREPAPTKKNPGQLNFQLDPNSGLKDPNLTCFTMLGKVHITVNQQHRQLLTVHMVKGLS